MVVNQLNKIRIFLVVFCLLQVSASVFASSEGNDEEQEIFNQFVEMLKFNTAQCLDQSKNFKIGEIAHPHNPEEKIDCNQVAFFHFKLIEQDHDQKLALSCVSRGWHVTDKMAFAKQLQLPLEEHFNCPGKDPAYSNGKCAKDILCSIMKEPIAIAKYLGMARKGCESNTESGCLTEAFWGLWKNLVTNVEGIWELVKLGGKGLKWTGEKVVDGVGWIGNKMCFWCEAEEAETVAETQQHVAAGQSDEFYKDFEDKPEEATGNLITRMFSKFKDWIGDSIQNNFGCAKWSDSRFDPFDGAEAKCDEPVISWDCATCDQKVNMACGVVGFLGGEIPTALMLGGGVKYIGKGLKAAKGAVSMASKSKVFQSIGQKLGASKGGLQNLTKAVGQSSIGQGVGTAVSWTGKTISGVMSLGISGMGVVAAGGKMAIRLGGKLIPLTAKRKDVLKGILSGTWKGTKKGLYYTTYPARKYWHLMEDAFVLGHQGRAGLVALRSSRKIAAMEKSLQLQEVAASGDFAALRVIAKKKRALEALQDYQVTVKRAAKASGVERKAIIEVANGKFRHYRNLQQNLDETVDSGLALTRKVLKEKAPKNASSKVAGKGTRKKYKHVVLHRKGRKVRTKVQVTGKGKGKVKGKSQKSVKSVLEAEPASNQFNFPLSRYRQQVMGEAAEDFEKVLAKHNGPKAVSRGMDGLNILLRKYPQYTDDIMVRLKNLPSDRLIMDHPGGVHQVMDLLDNVIKSSPLKGKERIAQAFDVLEEDYFWKNMTQWYESSRPNGHNTLFSRALKKDPENVYKSLEKALSEMSKRQQIKLKGYQKVVGKVDEYHEAINKPLVGITGKDDLHKSLNDAVDTYLQTAKNANRNQLVADVEKYVNALNDDDVARIILNASDETAENSRNIGDLLQDIFKPAANNAPKPGLSHSGMRNLAGESYQSIKKSTRNMWDEMVAAGKGCTPAKAKTCLPGLHEKIKAMMLKNYPCIAQNPVVFRDMIIGTTSFVGTFLLNYKDKFAEGKANEFPWELFANTFLWVRINYELSCKSQFAGGHPIGKPYHPSSLANKGFSGKAFAENLKKMSGVIA